MNPTFQAHPIPQNVTNFEFHLVGDMTLKQFGYLATGLGIAFLFFVTLATPMPFVAWPVIVVSSLLGVAFAFLPIQERPLDHWVGAFFGAIFKPTKLQYNSKIISKDDPFFEKRLNAYLKVQRAASEEVLSPLAAVSNNLPHKPSMADRLLKETAGQAPAEIPNDKYQMTNTKPTAPQLFEPELEALPQSRRPLPPLDQAVKEEAPKSEDLKKTVDLAKEAQTTQAKILRIEQQLSQVKTVAAKPGVDPKFYVEQFEGLLSELSELNKKASETAHELAVLSHGPTSQMATTPSPAGASQSPVPAAKPVPIAPKSVPTLNLTTFPNVINGIVTDSQGNYLEGAIIVAHDKQNLPVRALKSNKLGQFVAATPLPNGVYTIVTEKDNLVFETVSVELKGEILKPILIAAKRLGAANG